MTHVVRPDIRRSRVSLEGEAVIQGPDATWRVPLGDVSVTGLHLPRPPGFTLPVGQALEVELHCGPPEEGIDLLLLARVARTNATTLALRFAHVQGVVSDAVRGRRHLLAAVGLHGGCHRDLLIRR